MTQVKTQVEKVQKDEKGTTAKVAQTPKKATQNTKQKEQLLKVIEKVAPTADERIQNAENFAILTNKYNHLKGKKQELDQFKLSSDGNKEKIVLKNSQGAEIEVTNTNVLKEVTDLMTKTLEKLLATTKKEVEGFEI